jgi:hypothetical protein
MPPIGYCGVEIAVMRKPFNSRNEYLEEAGQPKQSFDTVSLSTDHGTMERCSVY